MDIDEFDVISVLEFGGKWNVRVQDGTPCGVGGVGKEYLKGVQQCWVGGQSLLLGWFCHGELFGE